jgi:hypothetical protein
LSTSAERACVLVKGWHDSGAIDGVYGPYSKARAEWIKEHLLDSSMQNWSVHELQDFAGAGAPDEPERQELSCTSASTERAPSWDFDKRKPAAFGFAAMAHPSGEDG